MFRLLPIFLFLFLVGCDDSKPTPESVSNDLYDSCVKSNNRTYCLCLRKAFFRVLPKDDPADTNGQQVALGFAEGSCIFKK